MSAAAAGSMSVISGLPAAFQRTITWRPVETSVVSRLRTVRSVSSPGLWR